MNVDLIEVELWGKQVGVAALSDNGVIQFNYHDDFISSGYEIAPITAPLGLEIFDGVRGNTFHGLPSFIADSLPDKFGNTLLNVYLARKNASHSNLSALDTLHVLGSQTMGALEFKPAEAEITSENQEPLVLASLVEEAKFALQDSLKSTQENALQDILKVGISAGGARAKAIVAMDEQRTEIRSGQMDAPEGFEHWLLKFDGVGKDTALGMSQDYGRIEYAYYLMASAAGIDMTTCDLLRENGRAHFITKRFDRIHNERIHMLSLCAIAQMDFNLMQAHSYEQFFNVTQMVTENYADVEQAILRAFFNVIARNQDDHTKNIAYLLDKDGQWRLSPAYDEVRPVKALNLATSPITY